MHTEFWDGVNFSDGANPPRADWKQPGTRPAAETEQAFRDFEAYVRFIKAQPGVRFVTATELTQIYKDQAPARNFTKEDLLRFSRALGEEITFQKSDGYALSAADLFGLLTQAIAEFTARSEWPTAVKMIPTLSMAHRERTLRRLAALVGRAFAGPRFRELFGRPPNSAAPLSACRTRCGSDRKACRR